ncbi:MAG TPA: histidine kinase dimerization/phospho-acceptor domain-containing protein [Croceibacterium sp.]|jgi:signal transduction histidine kinase
MITERHARRDAEDATEFAQSLAHTLNNLLQVINGNLELLETRVEDDRLRGYIRNAQLAAQQLTELADDLNGNAAPRPR